MSDAIKPFTGRGQRLRAPGLKLLLVCALVLLMSIPALFVFLVVYDRSSRAEKVRAEIALAAGGPQTLIGPVLAIPVQTRDDKGRWYFSDTLLIFADEGAAKASLDVSTRRKSLFAVQTYTGTVSFTAHFTLAGWGDTG